jgi:methylenetetrahydrofolate reductase (NADPH)
MPDSLMSHTLAGDGAALAARLARFLDDYSVETTPTAAAQAGSFEGILPAGTRVYIAHLPDADLEATVGTARRLKADGFLPVPHIAARRLPGPAAFEHLLGGLADAGVTRVLVIAGGVGRPEGPFADTMSLLRSGLLETHGITSIGVAGHPEGNRDIGEAGIARALAEKNAHGRATGSAMHIVTQFCFDAAAVIAWDRRLRAAGNALPIHIGIPGPAKLQSLMNYARLCGIGASARLLSRQAFNVARLATVSAPDRFVAAMATAAATDPACGITRAHFYTFGGLKRTARWVAAIREGDIEVGPGGDTFTVCRPLD